DQERGLLRRFGRSRRELVVELRIHRGAAGKPAAPLLLEGNVAAPTFTGRRTNPTRRDALQVVQTLITEPNAGPGDEIPDGARNQSLPRDRTPGAALRPCRRRAKPRSRRYDV